MKKIFLLTIFVAFLSIMILTGCQNTSANVETGSNVGQRLEVVSLSDLNGSKITLPVEGKISIINLWATWCPPCREEMPELQAFYNKYKNDSSIAIYLINHAESTQQIKDFMQKNNYDMPILTDDKNIGVKMLQTRGIPTTVVVDKKGIVVLKKVGPVSLQELEAAVAKVK